MSATYTEGGHDPVSRLRSELPDVDVGSAVFSDERLLAWLAASISRQSLHIAMPSNNTAGHLTGTVKAFIDAGQFKLELTAGADPAKQITIAPNAEIYTAGDVVDAILGLGDGWTVALGDGREVRWFTEATADTWERSIVSRPMRHLAGCARAADLQLTLPGNILGAEVALNAFGDPAVQGEEIEGAAVLRWYCYDGALLSALLVIESGQALEDQGFTARKEGNMSWSKGGALSARMREVGARVSMGIYGRAC